MPGVNSAHMCLSAAAPVFSHAARREGTAKKLWGCSTSGRSPPVQTQPIGAQRRGSRKVSNTDTSLATGFHQSRGRTTVAGTNLLCSLSLPLLFLCEKKKKKRKKKFCRGMKFTEQTNLVCFIESNSLYCVVPS